MHVVFVLPRFYPYRGGYENSLLALAKYLVAHGHRATVFTTVANDLEAFWLPGFKTFSRRANVCRRSDDTSLPHLLQQSSPARYAVAGLGSVLALESAVLAAVISCAGS